MNVAVLFDGAGLARLGLEQAGHTCTGFELDPAKHHLSKSVGSGNSVLADVCAVDLSSFDAIWASPPCQGHSQQNHGNAGQGKFGDSSLLDWSLNLLNLYPDKVIWIENVKSRTHDNSWGTFYNAVQFLDVPVQQRVRVIGGNFTAPTLFRAFKHRYKEFDVCPAVLASEYKQGGKARTPDKERRKATRWYSMKYNRVPTLTDMAYVQGFTIPPEWNTVPHLLKENGRPYTVKQWDINQSQAIGNGVPVYMAKAFGQMYPVALEVAA